MKVVLRPAAEQDIAEAIEWYDAQRIGLGAAFLAEVKTLLGKISKRPHGYPATHKPFRRALLQRFRYAIFFKTADEAITVFAVFHQRRKPQALARRLAEER